MITMEALALAQDTIRIALKTAGYKNVDSMTQFERASAILDMAQEFAALTNKHHIDEKPFDVIFNTRKAEVWERLAVRSWEQTIRGNPA